VSVALIIQDAYSKHHILFPSVACLVLPHSLPFCHETTRFILQDFLKKIVCAFSFIYKINKLVSLCKLPIIRDRF